MVDEKFKKVNIFSSKLFLIFSNKEMENVYTQANFVNFPSIIYTNILVSLFLIIFGFFNIIIPKSSRISEELVNTNLIISWTGIFLNFFTLLISILTKKEILILGKNKISFGYLISGINFFILGVYFILLSNFCSDYIFINKIQTDKYLIIWEISIIIKIIYAYYLSKKYIIIFFSCLSIFIIHVILWIIVDNEITYPQIGTQLFSLLICSIISYTSEASDRIYFFLLNRIYENKTESLKEQLISYKNVIDNLGSKIFTLNNSGKITHFNKELLELNYHNTEKDNQVPIKKSLFSSKTLMNDNLNENKKIDRKYNIYEFFKYNSILEEKENLSYDFEIKLQQNLKIILENLSYISEDLNKTHKKLYDYLENFKNSKFSGEGIENSQFDLKDFINVIYSTSSKKDTIFNHQPFLTKSETTKNLTSAKTNTYLLINNTENNTQKEIANSIESETLKPVRNLNLLKTKTFELGKNEKYIFLGKVSFSSYKKKKSTNNILSYENNNNEFFFSYTITENKEVLFILEDISQHLIRERKDTTNVCRSLYLSKISHELKNPICNLLEIVESLNDDVNILNSNNNIKKSKKLIIKNSRSSSDSDSDEELSNEIFENTSITKNINLCENLSKHVIMLKSIGEMMLLIFKDFTFYSTVFEDEGNSQNKSFLTFPSVLSEKIDKFESSNNLLKRENENSTLHNTLVSLPVPGNIPHSQTESLKISVRNQRKGTKTVNKICHYKNIIKEIVGIFLTKSEIDKKNGKLFINIKFDQQLPDFIEYDKEKFKSLIFNLIYHLYIETAAGVIDINVFYFKDENFNKNNNNKKISIQLSVKGNIISKAYTQGEKEIFSKIGTHNLKNEKNNDSLCSSADDSIQQTEQSKKKDSGNESCNSNESGHKSFKKNSSLYLENLHLKNILNVVNTSKRNSFIDDFNRKFHFYISHLYSKKLGLKLNFENEKREMKISFVIEYRHNSQLKRSILNPQVKKSKFEINISSEGNKKEYLTEDCELGTDHSNKNVQAFTKNKNNLSPSNFNLKYVRKGSSLHIKKNYTIKSFEENNSSNPKSSDRTLNLSGEIKFCYPYIINNNPIIRKICNLENEKTSVISNSNKQVLVNHGSLIINNYGRPHLLTTSKTTNELLRDENYETKGYKKSIVKKHSSNLDSRKIIQTYSKMTHQKTKIFDERLTNSMDSDKIFKTHKVSKILSLNSLKNSSLKNISSNINEKLIQNLSKNDFNVLLCDDENLIRKTLHRFFNLLTNENKNFNFTVEHAENGFECLNTIYQYHNQGKSIDILIIDETMPFFKGSQIIFLLKSMIKENNFKNIMIISFTSYDSPEKIDFIYSQGADYVLTKPLKFEDFKIFFLEEFLENFDVAN
jgi:CheY-like chemotaxis protein